MRIVVVMGGWSAEREVSLVTGEAVADALERSGHDVLRFDIQPDLATLLETLAPAPDAIFNALHGQFGEDGGIQAILNLLKIPYTHSGMVASALAMNKPFANRLFVDAGIRCPPHIVVSKEDAMVGKVMARPYVVKPLNDGSSVGVHIIRDDDSELPFADDGWPYGDHVMVERFIPGKELTVSVMGDRALAVTEITTERGFYDYDAKYAPGGSIHLVPAPLEKSVYEQALELSLTAHQTLCCRGVSRADIRYDGDNLYLLEINTQPGMTPTSLVPEQAESVGISFDDLVAWMIENAAYDP